MAVNLKDDYEKLAKLLYPSIEASGNVYYGQTRKLTLDEILKKNDCGFNSYVQSHREPDDSPQGFKYASTLEWKLGPISGSIPFNPDMYDSVADGLRYTFDNFPDTDTVELINFYDDEENCTIYPQSEYDGSDTDVKHLYREYLDGVLFAKYILEIGSNTISNLIGSGNFKTYEKNITAVFQGICCTDFFDPTNPSNRNVGDRRFYITEIDGQVYLYIQICSDGIELEVPAVAYVPQPLTLKATHGDFNFRLEAVYDVSDFGPEYDLDGVYEYSINNGTWQTIESFHREEVWGDYWTVSDYISLSEGDTISLRGHWREIYDYNHYVMIAMYSDDPNPSSEASGNITSMYEGYDTASGNDVQGIYAGLFEGCNHLVKAPKIPVTKYVQPYMFYKTFRYCANLCEMPLLLSNETNSHCYESMFASCTALRETSVMSFLPSSSFCDSMFSGCTQLNKVVCYSYDPYEMFDYSGWLNNTANVGEFFTINENAWTAGAGGIPSGWSVYEEPSYRRSMRYYTSLELDSDSNGTVLSTGTDSQENGRGIISDESTLYDMEESFDENDSHNMGTFNKDGSYNQDIWGYKSFNSPVQFRNGIYTDSMSVTSPQTYYSTFSFIDHNGRLDDAEFDKYSSFSISTLKINEDICPVSKNIAFSAYSVPYEIYDTTIHDYTERIDYISKDVLVSSLSNDEANHVISTGTETGMFSSVSTCAITKLLPEHPCIDPEPFRDSIKRYKSSMTAGESFIEVTADYSDENTLQNSSVNVMLIPYNQAQQLCGITMSDIEFSNTITDISFAGKDIAIINSRNFLDNSFYDNYRHAYMWSGNIIEQYSGVFNDDSNDLEYNASSTIIKSKEYGGPGTNLVESTIETNSSYDVSSSVLLESTSNTTSNSGNYIGNAKITLSSPLAATSSGTIIAPPPVTIKLTSEVTDSDDVSTKSEFKVRPDGCSIDEVPIVPKVRSFTGSPIFTKGSVHILVVTNFNQLGKIECGAIISSDTYQGDDVWHVGNRALPGTIIALGRICIGATGTISVDPVSPGYPNESVQFKVLNCRNASDTDKSLIVISMTDQSNANI